MNTSAWSASSRSLVREDDDYLTEGVLTRRCIAWCLDMVLIGVLVGALWFALFTFGVVTLGLGMPLLGVLPVAPFLYHFGFLASWGATPGQSVCGLAVRNNNDLEAAERRRGAGVHPRLLPDLRVVGGLLLICALFTIRRRALHDLLSGLVVIRFAGVDPAHALMEHARRIPLSSMTYKPPRRPQFFYTTAPLPCPYVPGRTERKVVTEITGPDADALHDRLSRAGFRRSHNIAYAPVCPSCQACVPIRIPVATFQPDRTLRRIARANALWKASRSQPGPRRNSTSCSSATSRPATATATWRR